MGRVGGSPLVRAWGEGREGRGRSRGVGGGGGRGERGGAEGEGTMGREPGKERGCVRRERRRESGGYQR